MDQTLSELVQNFGFLKLELSLKNKEIVHNTGQTNADLNNKQHFCEKLIKFCINMAITQNKAKI